MPTYSYECVRGHQSDALVTYENRLTPRKCKVCGKAATYTMSAPLITVGSPKGDKRIIVDERQVTSEKGNDWRDEGTTRRPGGAGKVAYYDGGRR